MLFLQAVWCLMLEAHAAPVSRGDFGQLGNTGQAGFSAWVRISRCAGAVMGAHPQSKQVVVMGTSVCSVNLNSVSSLSPPCGISMHALCKQPHACACAMESSY